MLTENDSEQKNSVMATVDAQAWIRVLTASNGESAKLCQKNVIGSVYKVDITIYGVLTRALLDSGSQVCIVRQQLLPIVKEKCNWKLSECLKHNLPLNAQPVGAEGSILGATALVNLKVTVEATGKNLEVPCYVIDSARPIWQGDAKDCGMIMGTNALVAFQFRILHANGIEISPISTTKQLESIDSLEPTPEESEQTHRPQCLSKLTESVECYKPAQLDQQLAQLVVLPNQLGVPKKSEVPKALVVLRVENTLSLSPNNALRAQ